MCGGCGREGATYVVLPSVSPCVWAAGSAPSRSVSSVSTARITRAAADAPAPRTPRVWRDASCVRSTRRFLPPPAMFFSSASTGGSSAPSVSSGSMAHIARAAADAPAPRVGRDMRVNDAMSLYVVSPLVSPCVLATGLVCAEGDEYGVVAVWAAGGWWVVGSVISGVLIVEESSVKRQESSVN